MAITYNNLIEVFEAIKDAHYQLHSFGHGDTSEMEGELSTNEVYPKLWVTPLDSTTRLQTQERTFQVFVFDLVHKDLDNQDDVISDTEQILNDVINILRQENDAYSVTNEPTLIPFQERFGEDVTGWTCEVTIESELRSNYCDIPKHWIINPIANGCDPSNNGNIPSTFDCEDLLGCEVITTLQGDIVILTSTIEDVYTELTSLTNFVYAEVDSIYENFQYYLPLSGGKMSGAIKLPQGTAIDFYEATGVTIKSGITWNGNTTYFLGHDASQRLRMAFQYVDLYSDNNTIGLATYISTSSTAITIGSSAVGFQGAKYAADYTASFVTRSLVDKGYVDSAIASASPNITASNGLTKTANDIALGGSISANTTITGGGNDFYLGTAGSPFYTLTQYSEYFNIYGNTQVSLSSQSVGLTGLADLLLITPSKSIRLYETPIAITGNGSNNGLIVYDDVTNKGLVYFTDYSANFTNESLVSKRYVDTAVSNVDLTNVKRASFGVGFMKGSGVITTSDTATLIMPCSGTITGWQIVENSDTPLAASIVVDVYKGTYAGYQPTASIAGSELPTLSSQIKNEDLTLTTWTTAFNVGDVFKFKVNSVTGAKNVLINIFYTKS